ncbi:MAG: hypothetical protein FJW40_05675 [Acidobacteria bacterium]|nr:hypothetical protein [Acidobacteriota bacterium]
MQSGKPRIFVCLKNASVNIGDLSEEDFRSRKAFEENLKTLGHYYTPYTDINGLKLHLRDQLDRLQSTH